MKEPLAWIQEEGITDTSKVSLPDRLIDEVIGQEEAVEVALKAARQGRHLLLLGDPGTGKSMIAKAMAQILPDRHLQDVVTHPNPKDPNQPRVSIHPGGKGRDLVKEAAHEAGRRNRLFTIAEWSLAGILMVAGLYALIGLGGFQGMMLMLLCLLVTIFFLHTARQGKQAFAKAVPKLLIEREPEVTSAPYVDGTGSHAGALLGDIRHDPFQSGGLQTPPHERVEPGAIHRAHQGLLFVDEINVLRLDSQQALLTAMQDKQYAITGQSENSSGAMARTDPVPCDFILVAAGNMDVIAPTDARYTGLHPALRSRIRGYGYEVYVRSAMDDTDDNRRHLVRFIAQEVRRDGKIPHFDGEAVSEVLREAQRRSGHSGRLTLRLRELGGLVRTAGDLALDNGHDLVTVDDVVAAKRMSLSLEHQVTLRGIELTTAREAFDYDGAVVGTARGCAFLGTGETGEPAGIVVPVEADATPAHDTRKGAVHVGGGLDAHVQENVSALLKRLRGKDMAGMDLHVQALLQQTRADTNALAAATAIACISAIEDIPVRQDAIILGDLAVGGRIRGVDGVTQMIEAAADIGYKMAVVPEANRNDVLLEHGYGDRIQVEYVPHISDALRLSLEGPKRRVDLVVNAVSRK